MGRMVLIVGSRPDAEGRLSASMRYGVQLITYADRFGGGSLSTIGDLLTGPLDGVFTGVHVLPFYRPFDGADAGFDPVDHRVVDPRLGTWEDIRRLAASHDVMADLIVNHISDESPQFLDFVAYGEDSAYASMFLEREAVFPGGATADELDAIYRPRPGEPFTIVPMADGSSRTMWATFTPHQIDLDTRDPGAASYLDEVLDRLAAAGVSQVRLDAVGYSVKTRGTSCFMTEDTYRFIGDLVDKVRERRMVPLLEVHSHHLDQIQVATAVDRVYDFALPPLVLHALYTGSTAPLVRWLAVSPRNAYTVLDTHDGIGVIDVGPDGDRAGLLSPRQIDQLVSGIDEASDGESRLATGEAASNLDLYQVNSTFFSALGCDEVRYLLARLIQFVSPGIPQVYYAGLLAARNDMTQLARTGIGRDINRPYVSMNEIVSSLELPVVRRLMALARFRNTHPAFAGTFHVEPSDDRELKVRWVGEEATLDAKVDVASGTFEIVTSQRDSRWTITSWDEFASVE